MIRQKDYRSQAPVVRRLPDDPNREEYLMRHHNATLESMMPHLTRRAFAVLAALVVTALLSAPVAPASAQTTTIKVWLHDHPPRVAIDKAIVAEFEKANPDIKVQYDVIPSANTGRNC
jgi:hypothetical protein